MSNWTTQDRIRVEIDTIPGMWQKANGHGGEREVQQRRPGAGEKKVTIATELNVNNITTVRMFNADTDVDLVRRLYKGAFAGTRIKEIYLDADGNAIPGKTLVHYGCAVVSFDQPEADAEGTDPGELSITWSRQGVE